jgi:hypothetical protein
VRKWASLNISFLAKPTQKVIMTGLGRRETGRQNKLQADLFYVFKIGETSICFDKTLKRKITK